MNNLLLISSLIFMFLVFMFAFLVMMLLLLSSMYSTVNGAPFVPNNKRVLKEALKLAHLGKKDVLMDLGSGDGRTLFYACKENNIKRGIGYEISPFPYWISLVYKYLFYRKYNISFYRKNMKSADLTKPTVIYVYLFPKLMKEIEPMCREFLLRDQNNRIVSSVFKFSDIKPSKIVKINHPTFMKEVSLYLYDSNSL